MNIYEDISKRTSGEIYIGVVGPVRSGKSTFVKKFMDNIVLPNIKSDYDRERAKDELPQSASGRTIMTTEPKFIPNEAVGVLLGNASMKVRLIDCVGYLVDGAIGNLENDEVRLVNTPWSNEPMEFEKAAELGTKKVICDHSTIGIVVTTDGTIGEIPRESYQKSEEKVVNELKSTKKPFVIVLNSQMPHTEQAQSLALSLEEKYNAPVALVNCLELSSEDFDGIMKLILGQFNTSEMTFNLPKYLSPLPSNHWLKESLINSIKASILGVSKIDDTKKCTDILKENEYVSRVLDPTYDMGTGQVTISIELKPELYFQILSEICKTNIQCEEDLFATIKTLSEIKQEYDKFSNAIDEVNETGYGIVLPNVEDMTLDEPEIIKRSGAYGVKLKSTAPSIHLIRASIETEINPIVGSEEQSREIIKNLLDEYNDDPKRLWESNMFGKSLYELINDGLNNKLEHISQDSRTKLSDTLSRVINEGSNGLICIIL